MTSDEMGGLAKSDFILKGALTNHLIRRGAGVLALNRCFGADYYGGKRATGDVMGAADRQLSLFGCARKRFA